MLLALAQVVFFEADQLTFAGANTFSTPWRGNRDVVLLVTSTWTSGGDGCRSVVHVVGCAYVLPCQEQHVTTLCVISKLVTCTVLTDMPPHIHLSRDQQVAFDAVTAHLDL
jgi:hypothetical protein